MPSKSIKKRYFGLVIRVPEVGGKRDNSRAGERSEEIHHHYSTARLGKRIKFTTNMVKEVGTGWDGTIGT